MHEALLFLPGQGPACATPLLRLLITGAVKPWMSWLPIAASGAVQVPRGCSRAPEDLGLVGLLIWGAADRGLLLLPVGLPVHVKPATAAAMAAAVGQLRPGVLLSP